MRGKEKTTPADRIDILIAPETHFRGKIVSRGTLRIDGQVEGEISTEGDVMIGESGRVLAQIQARNILVAGKVKGNLIPAGRIEIAATASLEGNIQVELAQ
ncbi:MAG: polymer-forming cytoskeletal protein [Firmicutes bacterium]|nr:polymer-forming cytoskeletal protein [Bacillota bacterium]